MLLIKCFLLGNQSLICQVSQDETDWCEMIFKVCSKVKSPNNIGATVMHIGTHFKMLDMALGDTTYAEYEGLYCDIKICEL